MNILHDMVRKYKVLLNEISCSHRLSSFSRFLMPKIQKILNKAKCEKIQYKNMKDNFCYVGDTTRESEDDLRRHLVKKTRI